MIAGKVIAHTAKTLVDQLHHSRHDGHLHLRRHRRRPPRWNKTFRVPLHLLSLGHVTVTGVRTISAPTDPNPANDNASASCTVIFIILVTCP